MSEILLIESCKIMQSWKTRTNLIISGMVLISVLLVTTNVFVKLVNEKRERFLHINVSKSRLEDGRF